MEGLCKNSCVECAFKKACGSCSICEASVCKRNCSSCSVVCFKRPKTIAYFNSIGGPIAELKPNESINLPVHIPVLPDRFKTIPKYNQIKIIGVHAGNMFSRNGEKINNSYTREGYAAALNLDRRTKAVLEFYVKDKTLEGFWDKRKSIYPVLKGLDFSAVIAPNYSVYEDAPRVDHMYNIKRSMIVYNELLESGIPAVPDVSWYNKSDLDRWCGEINKNNIKVIAFSFQVVDVGLKTTNIWRSYISGFRYLCRNIRSDVKIIVAGLVSPFRVLEIFKATCGQSLHILNQSAYVQSRRGMLSEVRMQDSCLSFDEIFERNIAYFNRIYEDICQGYQNNGILTNILQWDKEMLKQFYVDYTDCSNSLFMENKYGIEKSKLDLALSIVIRQLRKKKIHI